MSPERSFSHELWEQIPVAVQAYVGALEARVTPLEAAVQRLEATVQHLTERLQQDARTSSRPPSSHPPQARHRRPRHESSGRRPGGQPGHAGQTGMRVPVEEVDGVMLVTPARCRRCQQSFQGEDPQPQRHQVTESPPVKPVVTEYRLHPLICSACGEATRAEVPPGVPQGNSARGCRRSRRCARGPIICRSAQHKA
jgi:hypothetical protein